MIEVELVLTVISLIGMAGVSRHETRGFGFLVCLLGNVGWIVVGYMTAQLPIILLFAGYLIFNSIGVHDEYTRWKVMRDVRSKYKL